MKLVFTRRIILTRRAPSGFRIQMEATTKAMPVITFAMRTLSL
jgi:hypothetical protein